MISQTQAFYQYAIVAKNVIDPTHHPCLESLPDIFMKSMESVSNMVDSFLGIPIRTRPSAQKLSKGDLSLLGEAKTNNRPNVNSVLHLFGAWLFEAAFIGNEDLMPVNKNGLENVDVRSEKSLEMPA